MLIDSHERKATPVLALNRVVWKIRLRCPGTRRNPLAVQSVLQSCNCDNCVYVHMVVLLLLVINNNQEICQPNKSVGVKSLQLNFNNR